MKKYILVIFTLILLISVTFAGTVLTSITINEPDNTDNSIKLSFTKKSINREVSLTEPDGKIDLNDLSVLGAGVYTNVMNEKGERLIKETIIQCYDYHDKEQEGKLVEFCEERETGNYIFKKKAVVIKPW